MSTTPALRVLALEIDSFKRVEYLRLVPREPVTIIGGDNRQGKSSTLDAIEVLFSGKEAFPAEPVKRGERRARIKAELGSAAEVELTVELELNVNGTAKLKVLGPDGAPIAKPQTFLDSLFSNVSFDPLAFARMDPKEQDKVLRALDPETSAAIVALDGKRAGLFAERTDVNRDAKSLRAQFEAAPRHPDAPAEESSVSELSEKLETARAHNRARTDAARRVESAMSKRGDAVDAVSRAEEALARAKTALAEATSEFTAASSALETLDPDANVFPIQEQLKNAETVNAKVRANKARAKLQSDLDAAERRSQALSDELTAIDEKKAALLAAAKFPVPGLGFDELGPTYDGFPLDQASHSDRIKISLAIGMALHPTLRVLLMRDMEKVGPADMKTICELAERDGYQVFGEKFTVSGEGCSVMLEGGRIRENPAAAE